MFHLWSLLIPGLILAPNFWFFHTMPNNTSNTAYEKEPMILAILETMGRIGVFLLPVFYPARFEGWWEWVAMGGMAFLILVYYEGWVRYFTKGRDYRLLLAPLAGCPVPMAVGPVIYFLLASIVLHAPLLCLSSIILGLGHIPISMRSYARIPGERGK